MCPEEGGAAGLGELRSWWEVPAIAHFCSLFRTAFRLPDFEIEVSDRAGGRRRAAPPASPAPRGASQAVAQRGRGPRDFGPESGARRRAQKGRRAGGGRQALPWVPRDVRPGTLAPGAEEQAPRGRGGPVLLWERERERDPAALPGVLRWG